MVGDHLACMVAPVLVLHSFDDLKTEVCSFLKVQLDREPGRIHLFAFPLQAPK